LKATAMAKAVTDQDQLTWIEMLRSDREGCDRLLVLLRQHHGEQHSRDVILKRQNAAPMRAASHMIQATRDQTGDHDQQISFP
jgi:hypothetical protein